MSRTDEELNNNYVVTQGSSTVSNPEGNNHNNSDIDKRQHIAVKQIKLKYVFTMIITDKINFIPDVEQH
ncbi:15614_t:CDS:1, partial [Funneliformis geosporum]